MPQSTTKNSTTPTPQARRFADDIPEKRLTRRLFAAHMKTLYEGRSTLPEGTL